MRVLITGACGFVGSTLARELLASGSASRVVGIDSLARAGAETNRLALRRLGVELRHADLRVPSDLESLPAVDVVVDAAANPSVCAGVDGRTSSRQLLEHNLVGTLNVLEYCKRVEAGLIFLSTSRVYSIPPLAGLRVREAEGAYEPDPGGGGRRSAISLVQLSRWCRERLGEHPVAPDARERAFDVPWLVLDSSLARREWDWAPRRSTGEILKEILEHARRNSDWLDRSEDTWVGH